MLLLTIAYDTEFNISKDLQSLVDHFKKKKVALGLCESIEKNTHFIKILCDDKDFNENIRSMVNFYVSSILYNIIIDEFNKKEMYEFLVDTYFFLKNEELQDIQSKILEVFIENDSKINDSNIYYINRKNNIINKIKVCIEENQEINIDGFITFRMKEVIEDLENIADKVVERYMVEKEYNEFIKLLKYFVEIQESKMEEVNILISEDGNYTLRDSDGKDIFDDFLSELLDCRFCNPSINIEDIIISGLITNAPKKIIIHGSNYCNNKEILETIKNVFTNRVVICESCKMCNKSKIKV